MILRKDLESKTINLPIVLLKTKNSIRGFNNFYEDFTYLTEEGADFLIEKDIKLIGIDAPSIKQFHVENEVHSKLLKHGIYIVEGIDLSQAEEEVYNFIGLPLKIEGADGSPIRAILYK